MLMRLKGGYDGAGSIGRLSSPAAYSGSVSVCYANPSLASRHLRLHRVCRSVEGRIRP